LDVSAVGGQPTAMFRHTPTNSERTAELWLFANNQYYRHRLAGAGFAGITGGTINGTFPTYPCYAASFNGKLFLTHLETTGSPASAVDRLHVYDGTSLRRVGLAQPAAPTAADTGSGTYTATIRYYKVSYEVLSGTTVLRRSELSAALTFTPSGSGTAVRITKPATISESETHWTVWGSPDNANFYQLSRIAVATTTYDDSTAPSSYSSGTLAPDVNTNLPLPYVTYVTVDENRLLCAKDSRVIWTPVLGSDGVGDDERYLDTTEIKNYLDLDEKNGGGITGFGGPLLGSTIVFKESQTYKLVRTGNVEAPYLPVTISKTIGCIRQETVCLGEDEDGEPCLYWLANRGAYRLGPRGFQFIGRDIESQWDDWYPDYPYGIYPHGVYYTARKQVWWVMPSAEVSGGYPISHTLIFDVRRSAWSIYTGPLQRAACSVMFGPDESSGASMDLKPHFVFKDGVSTWDLGMGDTGTTDDGTPFEASVTTKPFLLGGPMTNHGVTQVEVLAEAGGEVAITLTRDFGLETKELTLDLEPEGDETRVIRQVEDLQMSSAKAIQVTIGDLAPTEQAWLVDQVVLKYRGEEPR
jgi:hypothetical protein